MSIDANYAPMADVVAKYAAINSILKERCFKHHQPTTYVHVQAPRSALGVRSWTLACITCKIVKLPRMTRRMARFQNRTNSATTTKQALDNVAP